MRHLGINSRDSSGLRGGFNPDNTFNAKMQTPQRNLPLPSLYGSEISLCPIYIYSQAPAVSSTNRLPVSPHLNQEIGDTGRRLDPIR